MCRCNSVHLRGSFLQRDPARPGHLQLSVRQVTESVFTFCISTLLLSPTCASGWPASMHVCVQLAGIPVCRHEYVYPSTFSDSFASKSPQSVSKSTAESSEWMEFRAPHVDCEECCTFVVSASLLHGDHVIRINLASTQRTYVFEKRVMKRSFYRRFGFLFFIWFFQVIFLLHYACQSVER